jgi:hypothetical protein
MMHTGIPSGKLVTEIKPGNKKTHAGVTDLLISTLRDSVSKKLIDRGNVVMHIPFMEELLGGRA